MEREAEHHRAGGLQAGNRRLALWLGIALFLVPGALFLVVSKFASLADDPTAGVTPAATATFDDGFRLTVLRAELTEELRFDCTLPFNPLRRFFSRSNSDTYATRYLFVEKTVQDGHLRDAALRMQEKGPSLMLLVYGKESDGRPFSSDLYWARGEGFEITRHKGIYQKSERMGSLAKAMLDLPLSLEAEDGNGGWLPFDGPIVVDEKDGRGFAALKAFPRRSPTLKIRANRKGFASVEFTIPTPGYAPAFATAPPESPPITREKGEFKVMLQSVKRSSHNGVRPDFLLGDTTQMRQIYSGAFEVQDLSGNVFSYDSSAMGYLPLPGEGTLRILYRAQRNPSQYPWKESEVLMFGEARLSSDGKSIADAHIMGDGSTFGFANISCSVTSDSAGSGETPKIKITVSGESSPAERARLERSYEIRHAALFWTYGLAEGVATLQRSMETRPLSGPMSFESTHEWEGTLHPGETFRIGLVPKQTPVEFEFIVKVPPPNAGKPATRITR